MNNKKILLEIIVIPLCISYLIFRLLGNYNMACYVICNIFCILSALVFGIKYIREVYIYENKYNILKILFSIYSVLLIVILVINMFLNINIIDILYIIIISGFLLYLLSYSIFYIIKIIKNKGKLYQNIINSFLSFCSFAIIISTFVINLLDK